MISRGSVYVNQGVKVDHSGGCASPQEKPVLCEES